MKTPYNLAGFESAAAESLPPGALAYISSGSFDEVTLTGNVAGFLRRRFRPRVLRDVSKIDTTTTILGSTAMHPFGIAPTAQHGLAHPDAEAATARAAAAAGVIYCASTMSTLPLEEIARAADGPRWFQLYIQRDRSATADLIARAKAAEYTAIVLTVDTAVAGWRERDMRIPTPIAQTFGNLGYAGAGEELGAFIRTLFDPSATWDDIAWLRATAGLPLVLKGIVTAEDTRLAVEHGVDAVWVSNHGGRQLDRAPATIDVLEEVVDASAGRAEVYLDGGVRRGSDVAAALALGARAVFIGRPVLYALAYEGEAGVRLALDLLSAELRNTMALLGAPSLSTITRAHVALL